VTNSLKLMNCIRFSR